MLSSKSLYLDQIIDNIAVFELLDGTGEADAVFLDIGDEKNYFVEGYYYRFDEKDGHNKDNKNTIQLTAVLKASGNEWYFEREGIAVDQVFTFELEVDFAKTNEARQQIFEKGRIIRLRSVFFDEIYRAAKKGKETKNEAENGKLEIEYRRITNKLFEIYYSLHNKKTDVSNAESNVKQGSHDDEKYEREKTEWMQRFKTVILQFAEKRINGDDKTLKKSFILLADSNVILHLIEEKKITIYEFSILLHFSVPHKFLPYKKDVSLLFEKLLLNTENYRGNLLEKQFAIYEKNNAMLIDRLNQMRIEKAKEQDKVIDAYYKNAAEYISGFSLVEFLWNYID